MGGDAARIGQINENDERDLFTEADATLDYEGVGLDSYHQQPIVLYAQDFVSDTDLENAVTTELAKSETGELIVIFDKSGQDIPTKRAAPPIGKWIKMTQNGKMLYFKYNGRKADTRGASLQAIQGDPGVELNLSLTKSVSAQYSASLGVDAKFISSVVGFSVTTSYSVTHSGKYTVPSKVNGRKVKYSTVRMGALYNTHSYSVRNASYPNGKDGTAKKPYGMYYSVAHTYK